MRLSNRQLSRKFDDVVEILSLLERREKQLRGKERSCGGIIYARVSTGDQAKGYSPDFQKSESINRLEELDVPFIDGAFFYDEGVSGRKIERENFIRAIKYAIEHAESVSHFMVYCSDRYARKAIMAGLSRKFLRGLGIKACSVVDRMEELSETELAKREAENEEAAIQGIARTILGMKRAREEGKHTSMPPYGYTNSPPQLIDGKYQRLILFDPDLEEYARLVWKLALLGEAQHQIRKETATAGAPMRFRRNKPIDIHTVHRVLKNKFYTGRVRVEGDIWVPGMHQAMISIADYEKVQVLLGFSSSPQAVPHVSDRDEMPLRRFVRCENCGSSVTGSWTKNDCNVKYQYYRCYRGCTRSIPGKTLHDRFTTELWRIAPGKETAMLLRKAIQDILNRKTTHYLAERSKVASQLVKEKFSLFQASNNLSSGVLDKQSFGIVQETHLSRIRQFEARQGQLENLDSISDEAVQKALDVFCKAPSVWPTLDLEKKQLLQNALFPEGVTMTRDGELIALSTPLSRINELLNESVKSIGKSTKQRTCNSTERKLSDINSNKIRNTEVIDTSSTGHRVSIPLATAETAAITEDGGDDGGDNELWCPRHDSNVWPTV